MRHLTICVLVCAAACGGGNTGPESAQEAAPGSETTGTTTALETAANMIQSDGPVGQISYYLDGFHVAKGDVSKQMEAHHYCNQVTEDFAQCVLYDGNTADARLSGIEYIISASLYDTLPADERAFWHPHNYEILSGQLRMPGVPDAAEQQALEAKINSYGKTWHTWMTGMYEGESDRLPLGPPVLQWSFNRDGQAKPGMVEARDSRMDLSTDEARRDRQDLVSLARPQGGVDALSDKFSGQQTPINGVADNGDATAGRIPSFSWEQTAGKSGGR